MFLSKSDFYVILYNRVIGKLIPKVVTGYPGTDGINVILVFGTLHKHLDGESALEEFDKHVRTHYPDAQSTEDYLRKKYGETIMEKYHSAATVIQSMIRGYISRKKCDNEDTIDEVLEQMCAIDCIEEPKHPELSLFTFFDEDTEHHCCGGCGTTILTVSTERPQSDVDDYYCISPGGMIYARTCHNEFSEPCGRYYNILKISTDSKILEDIQNWPYDCSLTDIKPFSYEDILDLFNIYRGKNRCSSAMIPYDHFE